MWRQVTEFAYQLLPFGPCKGGGAANFAIKRTNGDYAVAEPSPRQQAKRPKVSIALTKCASSPPPPPPPPPLPPPAPVVEVCSFATTNETFQVPCEGKGFVQLVHTQLCHRGLCVYKLENANIRFIAITLPEGELQLWGFNSILSEQHRQGGPMPTTLEALTAAGFDVSDQVLRDVLQSGLVGVVGEWYCLTPRTDALPTGPQMPQLLLCNLVGDRMAYPAAFADMHRLHHTLCDGESDDDDDLTCSATDDGFGLAGSRPWAFYADRTDAIPLIPRHALVMHIALTPTPRGGAPTPTGGRPLSSESFSGAVAQLSSSESLATISPLTVTEPTTVDKLHALNDD